MERLAGKTALVTGAARGTGAEIARQFVAQGAQVVLADVLDDRGTAHAEALGNAARFVHLDVTDEVGWEAVVGSIDTLHVLVNNAAVLHLATIDATTAAAYERVMRVNAFGPFLGTRTCLPQLRETAGSIVNIGSIDSVAGVALASAYTASKFALRGLTKVTALENAKWKVRANIVCPAAGNPEMLPSVVGMGDQPAIRRAPDAPPPDLAVVAEAAVFLASDESRMCNGTEIVLDRGTSAGMKLDLPDAWFDPALRAL